MHYGFRARIGYTSPPATTEVFPYEFYLVAPKGVTLVITTLAIMEMDRAEVDRSYQITLAAVDAMRQAEVDVMVLGGVPINVSKGHEHVPVLIKEMEQKVGCPVTTSITAQVEALRRVGAKRVAVGHPFADEPGKMFIDYTDHYGFERTALQGLQRHPTKLGLIRTEDTIELGRSLMRQAPKTDTIWLPCPHWACAEAIEPLEKEFGVNVVTANQAIAWKAMRIGGIEDKIQGYGRLLRDA